MVGNITMDIREIWLEVVDWIRVAQNMNQSQVLGEMRNFLSS
jgi:hypothetical protein